MSAQIITLADRRPRKEVQHRAAPLSLDDKKRLERLLIRDIASNLAIGGLPPLQPEPRDERLRAAHAAGLGWGVMA